MVPSGFVKRHKMQSRFASRNCTLKCLILSVRLEWSPQLKYKIIKLKVLQSPLGTETYNILTYLAFGGVFENASIASLACCNMSGLLWYNSPSSSNSTNSWSELSWSDASQACLLAHISSEWLTYHVTWSGALVLFANSICNLRGGPGALCGEFQWTLTSIGYQHLLQKTLGGWSGSSTRRDWFLYLHSYHCCMRTWPWVGSLPNCFAQSW